MEDYSVDLELLRDVDASVNNIASQNETYAFIDHLDPNKKMGEIAISELCVLEDEQVADFEFITEVTKTGVYDQLGLGYIAALSRLDDIDQTLRGYDQKLSEIVADEQLEALKLRRLLPHRSKDVDSILLDQITSSYPEDVQEMVINRYLALLSVKDIEDLIVRHGNAWQIPRLLGKKQMKGFLDKFPDDKAESEGGKSCTRQSPEYIETNASAKLAAILVSKKGAALTMDEIGQLLYGDSVESDSRLSRVSALISNFDMDKIKIIGEYLEDRGLVLQRGGRYTIVNNQRVGVKRVIFRAIDPQLAASAELQLHTEDEKYEYVDWQILGKIAGRARLRLVS